MPRPTWCVSAHAPTERGSSAGLCIVWHEKHVSVRVDVSWIRLQQLPHRRCRPVCGRLHDDPGACQIVAGPVGHAGSVRTPLVGGIEVLPHRVTLTAHLGRPRRRQCRRLHDGGITGGGEVLAIAPQRAHVRAGMMCRRAVARLAGDPDLGDLRIGGELPCRVVRRVEATLAGSRMAVGCSSAASRGLHRWSAMR